MDCLSEPEGTESIIFQYWTLMKLLTYFKYTHSLINSTNEIMFSPEFVCVFVSFFVNKITQKLMDGF